MASKKYPHLPKTRTPAPGRALERTKDPGLPHRRRTANGVRRRP
jgi:hypothetical protein